MPDTFKKLTELRGKPQFREFSIKPEDIDKENRTVKLSWGSDTPVERYYGIEILDFKKKSVRMGRLNNKAALLLNHDVDQQVGAVMSATIEDQERGYAIVKVSKSRDDIWNDILDGIRTLVSVGYSIYEAVTESVKDGLETVRILDWEPFEVSLVGIPADDSVGVGRASDVVSEIQNNKEKEDMKNRMKVLRDADAPDGARSSGGGSAAPASAAAAPVVQSVNEGEVRSRAIDAERKRTKEIRALGARAKVEGSLIDSAINEGWTEDRFRQEVFERSHPQAQPISSTPNLDLTENEKRSYSIVRAMDRLASKKPVDGFEKELSDEVAKRTRREAEGFFIPGEITHHNRSFDGGEMHAVAREIRALSAEIAAAGGYTVQTNVLGDSMIELLRNKTLVNQLGALLLTGLVGDVAIPRQNGGAVAYWLGEGDDAPESDQTFGQIALRPRRLAALTAYTKQLLAQSSIGVELFVRNDLMRVLAIAKDLAAINGSGADGQPLGILNTDGIGSVTFGGPPSWPKMVSFDTKLGQANADRGARAWLTTPGTKGNLETILKASNSGSPSNTFICEDNKVKGYALGDTNQVPNDLVLFGNWNDLVMADWDGLDVVVDPYVLAAKGQVRIVLNLMTDIGIRHPQSFVVSSDSGAQ